MPEAIRHGSRVRLHFALHLDNGDTVDSTFGRAPAELVLGDGNLLPGFEAVLEGLVAGDHQTFPLAPEQAFGIHRPENIQVFPEARFPKDLQLVPGLVIHFADKAGAGLPGVIRSVAPGRIEVDFNHPLAGRTIGFEVEILAVEPPEPA